MIGSVETRRMEWDFGEEEAMKGRRACGCTGVELAVGATDCVGGGADRQPEI